MKCLLRFTGKVWSSSFVKSSWHNDSCVWSATARHVYTESRLVLEDHTSLAFVGALRFTPAAAANVGEQINTVGNVRGKLRQQPLPLSACFEGCFAPPPKKLLMSCHTDEICQVPFIPSVTVCSTSNLWHDVPEDWSDHRAASEADRTVKYVFVISNTPRQELTACGGSRLSGRRCLTQQIKFQLRLVCTKSSLTCTSITSAFSSRYICPTTSLAAASSCRRCICLLRLQWP